MDVTDSKNIAVFDDLVEGARQLHINIVSGMIELKIHGGREQFRNQFLLDSEEVAAFRIAIGEAYLLIPRIGGDAGITLDAKLGSEKHP